METKLDADIINRIRVKFMLRPDGEKHIRKYLHAVEEATSDDSLPLEDKLRRLITPLLLMLHDDSPNFDNHVQVVDEDYIDLKNEVDTENLFYDDEKYSIENPIDTGDQWVLDTNAPAISLSEKYSDYLAFCRDIKLISEDEFEGIYRTIQEKAATEDEDWRDIPVALFEPVSKLTLKEVHDLWLPTLTQKTIVARDLLQQILVTYSIKRAQNGHEESARRLFALFENQVKFERGQEGRPVINTRTVRNTKRLICSTLHIDLENVDFYDHDIIQAARGYLWFILTGFNPRQIVDGIMRENENHPVPKKIKEFYLRLFAEEVPKELVKTIHQLSRYEVVFSLCERVVRQLTGRSEKISDAGARLKQLENLKRQVEWAMNDLGITVDTLLNPYRPIMEGFWADGKGKTHMFNTYCYRPNKRGNLTVWLFGPKGNPEYGRVHQLVRDDLYKEIGKYVTTESVNATKPDRSENGDRAGEDVEQQIPLEDSMADIIRDVENRDVVARVFEYLERGRFSERDIDIFREHILYGTSAEDLERKYGIGARQQQKIVKKIEKALKEALDFPL